MKKYILSCTFFFPFRSAMQSWFSPLTKAEMCPFHFNHLLNQPYCWCHLILFSLFVQNTQGGRRGSKPWLMPFHLKLCGSICEKTKWNLCSRFKATSIYFVQSLGKATSDRKIDPSGLSLSDYEKQSPLLTWVRDAQWVRWEPELY